MACAEGNSLRSWALRWWRPCSGRTPPTLRQPGKVQTIGFLGTTTPTIWSANVAAFLERLRELGWIDGRNHRHRIPLDGRAR
jgi:hypothetical protein